MKLCQEKKTRSSSLCV